MADVSTVTTPADAALSEAIAACQRDVHSALCDNISTGVAMAAILGAGGVEGFQGARPGCRRQSHLTRSMRCCMRFSSRPITPPIVPPFQISCPP